MEKTAHRTSLVHCTCPHMTSYVGDMVHVLSQHSVSLQVVGDTADRCHKGMHYCPVLKCIYHFCTVCHLNNRKICAVMT